VHVQDAANVCMCVHMCVYVNVCTYVCIRVCVCVCRTRPACLLPWPSCALSACTRPHTTLRHKHVHAHAHTHIHTHTHAHMHTQDAANVLWALAKLRFDPGYSALSPVLSSLSSGKHGAGGCVHTSSKPDRCARTP